MEKHYGFLSATDAMSLLIAGLPIYVVSAPPETNALPLEGGWVDDEGHIHIDCSAFVLNPLTAQEIGRAFNQQCIMAIYPCASGNSAVYLLRDSEFVRQVALKYCGGYTADGSHLLTAVPQDRDIFSDGYVEYTTADVEYIPVK
jgi:hypothetical protein